FIKRERAAGELEKMGYGAEAMLRKKLDDPSISPEGVRRIQSLLDAADRRWNDLRMSRVIEALERARSPEAVALLRQFAEGDGAKLRGEESRAALKRLKSDTTVPR